MPVDGVRLEDAAAILTEAGYETLTTSIGWLPEVLLAENALAVVAVIDILDWGRLYEDVTECQSNLVNLASKTRSAKMWDLYVLALVPEESSATSSRLIEQLEADTQYVRKYVRRVACDHNDSDVRRALKPFLPLTPIPTYDASSPLEDLRQELLDHGLESAWVSQVFDRYAQTQEVEA